MRVPKGELLQSVTGVALLACLLSPLCEILLRSDSSIFVTGHDAASTFAVVLLVTELAFAIAKLLAFVSLVFLAAGEMVRFEEMISACSIFLPVPPTISPPGSLRI